MEASDWLHLRQLAQPQFLVCLQSSSNIVTFETQLSFSERNYSFYTMRNHFAGRKKPVFTDVCMTLLL